MPVKFATLKVVFPMRDSILFAVAKDMTIPAGRRIFLMVGAPSGGLSSVLSVVGELPRLSVGAYLGRHEHTPLFQVAGRMRWPEGGAAAGREVILADALEEVYLPTGAVTFTSWTGGYSLAWITLSDKGAAGLREDSSGPLVGDMIAAELSLSVIQGHILPDEERRLKALLTDLALNQGFDIIVTTGGTGVGPRDITPEATMAVVSKRLPGFEVALYLAGLKATPRGVISRAVAGILGDTLILNLPGSPKGVREMLAAVLPAMEHTLQKAHGDASDCAK